jgi:hypothetical protein
MKRNLVRALVYRFDVLLRRQARVHEFTDDEACILRIALRRWRRDLELPDGTRLRFGDRVCELHFWNEHIPPMPKGGPDVRWAVRFHRLAVNSMTTLATYLSENQDLADVVALHGEIALSGEGSPPSLADLARQLGFDVVNLTAGAGRWGRFAHFWENIYSWALMWAFNPATLRRKRFLRLQRYEFWISRAAFLRQFGT